MGRYARNSIGQYAPVGAAADDLPGGATPTGKKTIDTTAEVDVASYATAQVVDENLTAENIKKDVEVLGILGEFEGGGGGGGGDYTTATVTMTANVTDDFWAAVPNLWDDGMHSIIDSADMTSEDFTIVLYKGEAILTITGNHRYSMVATGDIEVDGQAIITGDGTITFTQTS